MHGSVGSDRTGSITHYVHAYMQCTDVRHRDVVTSLLLGSATAKITDFGMAMRMTRDQGFACGPQGGTPFYVAPEVLHNRQLHRASDVYAFGVIMWELMMGRAVYMLRCALTTSSSSAQRSPARQHAYLPHVVSPCLWFVCCVLLRAVCCALRAVLNHGLATRSWRAGRWPPRPASTTQRRRRGRCMSSTPTSRTSPAACR